MFLVRPHPLAPVFSQPSEDPTLLINQLIAEVESPNFQATEVVRELLRQAGFVNLWFFLKFIAGFSGPYEKLNNGLHLEMCNYRQSQKCMRPGARAAAVMPRNHRKTTIFTHGANNWELTRDPSLVIILVAATDKKAKAMKRVTQRCFDTNELYSWLYPENTPARNQPRWNEEEFVMPTRDRDRMDPSLLPLGVMASAASWHGGLLNMDDLIDLDDLDSEHVEAGDMLRKINWFQTNSLSLLEDWNTSRIVAAFTRYGLEDLYQFIVDDACSIDGYPMSDTVPKAGGTWAIYNRLPVENGKFIQPETMNQDMFKKMVRDDPWTAQTQYFNSPVDSGVLEFRSYTLRRSILEYDENQGYLLLLPSDSNFEEEQEILALKDCDVVGAVDLAGTENPRDSKHTQTAVVVWARDYRDRDHLLYSAKGYWDTFRTFDEIFQAVERFHDYMRLFVVEQNAMQKTLLPLLQEEAIKRELPIYFHPKSETANKDARIRNVVGLKLAKGLVYAVEGAELTFLEEAKMFPRAKYKKDCLDASEKAMSMLQCPESPEETIEREEAEVQFMVGRNRVSGY